jgi:hypothetical protein
MKKLTLSIPLPDKTDKRTKSGNFFIWNAGVNYDVVMPDGSIGKVQFQVMSPVNETPKKGKVEDKLRATVS